MEKNCIMSWIISGVFFWATTFILIRRALPKKSFNFCNRIVSMIHAILGVSMATISVQDWSCPVCPLASKSSQLQMKTLAITLSYMIYDLIGCKSGKNLSIDNAVHHGVSIVGIGAGLAYQQCGSEMVAALWITEISSPFLHMRELLKELGYRDTKLNFAFDILFAVIFSFARMVLGPYLAYMTLKADNPILVKVMAMGLQLVSVFWFYKILVMMRYKLKRRILAQKPAESKH